MPTIPSLHVPVALMVHMRTNMPFGFAGKIVDLRRDSSHRGKRGHSQGTVLCKFVCLVGFAMLLDSIYWHACAVGAR